MIDKIAAAVSFLLILAAVGLTCWMIIKTGNNADWLNMPIEVVEPGFRPGKPPERDP